MLQIHFVINVMNQWPDDHIQHLHARNEMHYSPVSVVETG